MMTVLEFPRPSIFRKLPKMLAAYLSAVLMLGVLSLPARASINSMNLGASYTSSGADITFRVYSSQATRIVVYLYSAGYGVQESATYTLSPAGSNVWQVIVPVSAIQSAGITGTVYYGYRAWGPNWTSPMSTPVATASTRTSC